MFNIIFSVFEDFAAHLKKFYGTLVCRGTPVEKHCSRLMDFLMNGFNYSGRGSNPTNMFYTFT